MSAVSGRLALIALACLALCRFTPGDSTKDDWRSLFNGKDLSGWRANVQPESFKVVDGTIRAQAVGNSRAHLFFAGDRKDGQETFKNFEFEATVRGEPNSNSGLFIHTDESTRDNAKHLAKGYEIQLNSSAKEKRKTGSLYAVVDLDRSPVDETKWFKVRVRVEGKRIVVQINDHKSVDYVEPDDVKRPPERAGRMLDPKGGAIAIQAHDPQSVFYFKDIRIRPLP